MLSVVIDSSLIQENINIVSFGVLVLFSVSNWILPFINSNLTKESDSFKSLLI
jgi:hypothetical protein